MPNRIEVTTNADSTDALGEATKRRVREDLGINATVRTVNVYTIDGMPAEDLEFLGRKLFSDPITERFSVNRPVARDFDYAIQVGYKPGVKDTVGEVSSDAILKLTGARPDVYTSKQFLLTGDISEQEADRIAHKLLANEAVEEVRLTDKDSFSEERYLPVPKVTIRHEPAIHYIDLNVSDERLMKISGERSLALNLQEMHKIRDYDKMPTDGGLEVTGQSWSEHCKHKIFRALVEYTDEKGKTRTIDSLFDTYIKRAAEELKKRLPWIVSVLEDNAGVVQFNDNWLLAVKCETHNSPSNEDPYGGAITGIVGVYRDPMGTGKGSKLLYGTYAFCTGDPDYNGELRPKLHPRRLLEGVRKGVQDGGNKHGVPTPYGQTYFHDGYMGKPAIFVKAAGLIPAEINGEPGHEKDVKPDDLIVMCGGRVGIDGIHGATESSLEAGKWITMGHVQMGDPYTQKKMHDFLVEARDRGLYRFVQDNGAGGLSSSVGETAQFSNGFKMDLKKVPLKYDGLDPWQILVSESQERMTLAVSPEMVEEFSELAKLHDVESTVLGKFTDNGKFHVVYGDKTVAYMDMDFVHKGVPQMHLRAVWKTPEERGLIEPELEPITEHGDFLRRMLARPNIAGKEYIVRQFDHEVQGTSAVKPLVGEDSDVYSDGVVLKPLYDSWEGLALGDGLNPALNQIDPYWGTLYALDEANRRMIAVGANPDKICHNDNFCWPSPLPSEKNSDAEYKMAQLVRANQALYDGTTRLRTPCVSGKDSMSMDGTLPDADGNEHRISAIPTIKFSGDGKVDDVRNCVTMDVKKPGDAVYILGTTGNELGGSEFYEMRGEIGLNVPRVDLRRARALYEHVHEAMSRGLVASCHGCYKGGLGVALAQSSFAGGYGIDVDLRHVPRNVDSNEKVLYSESAGRFVVTVPKEKQAEFEKVMKGRIGDRILGRRVTYGAIGRVTDNNYMSVTGLNGNSIINADIKDLKQAWKSTYAGR